jgi:hypothetical protein
MYATRVLLPTDSGILTFRQPERSQPSLIFDVDGSEIKEREMRTCAHGARVRRRGHEGGHEGQLPSHDPIIKSRQDYEAADRGGDQTGGRREGAERHPGNRSK